MSLNTDNLLQEFIAESKEHLTAIEPDLLTLEKEGSDADHDVINRIFRAIHSIKGAAGFFNLETVKALSHTMENVLMLIRDGKLTINPEITDVLLQGVDKLEIMIGDIYNSDAVDCDHIIESLENIADNQDVPSAPEDNQIDKNDGTSMNEGPVGFCFPEPDSFKPERQAVINELAQGNMLYIILFEATKEDDDETEFLNPFGLVLAKQLFEGNMAVLFASSLALDKIAETTGLQPQHIHECDFMEVLEGKADKPQTASQRAKSKSRTQEQQKKAASESTAVATQSPESVETVRVKVELLNKLMNLAGEMVLVRNQLTRTVDDRLSDIEGLSTIMQNLDFTTTDMQEHIMQTRMQPIGNIFCKFPRVVRDISRQLNKEINLIILGEDVELDKSLIENLSDPLTHLIRNACDHGIEAPDDREKDGKRRTGTVELKAFHEGGQINVVITDDGNGIDGDTLAEKAIKSGQLNRSDAELMTEREKFNLIFLPGLSTAKGVSDVSGRGVGMDVVRTNIEKLGGQITVKSVPGKSTTIHLRLPLTLAIIPSLIVRAEDHRFAIAQANLVELICIKAKEISQKIEKVGSAEVLRLRGKLLPLVHLANVLGIEKSYVNHCTQEKTLDRRQTLADARREEGISYTERRQHVNSDYYIAVVRVGSHQYGLIIDTVLDLEEVVVKPLSMYLKDCPCFSGSTIMGDGRVAMILDVGGIASYGRLNFKDLKEEERKQQQETLNNAHLTRMDIILFNNAEDEIFAVPLAEVLRLEKFLLSDIETIGSQEYLTYRGKGMPLIRLENQLPVQPFSNRQGEGYLIIPKTGNCDAGIIASRILDTLNVEANLQEVFTEQYDGVLGAAVINERLTPFINPEGMMKMANITITQTTETLSTI